MTDLARFLLDRIDEDETPHRDAKLSPQPGDEYDCPCGQRGTLDDYRTFDGKLDGTLSITHVIGATPPVIIGHEIVRSGGDPVTATHILSEEQSYAIFDAMPMPKQSRRILADCAAKANIVKMFQLGPPAWDDPLTNVLYLLAAPYSDHPDFDPSWATGGTPQ